MPVGIQVFDANGRLLIDVTTHLSRLTGNTTIAAGSSGSVVVPGAGTGTIWYAVHPTQGNNYVPVITLNGDTLSWSPNSGYPGGPVDVLLYYGRF